MPARKPRGGSTWYHPVPAQKQGGLVPPKQPKRLSNSSSGSTGSTPFLNIHPKKKKEARRPVEGVCDAREKECPKWVDPVVPADISAECHKGNMVPTPRQEGLVPDGSRWIHFLIPIRTGRGLNNREFWAARARRVKKERRAVWAYWPRAKLRAFTLPIYVLLTRIAPSPGLDGDNLQGSLKAIRDQVAAQLGVDDGDTASIRFEYAQERGPWGIRVQLWGSP